MRKVLSFEAARVAPEWAAIARRKDVPADRRRIDEYRTLFDRARHIFVEYAAPRGLVEEIDDVAFNAVIQGNGCLDEESPVREVFERADRRFLFAATVGARIVGKIADAFRADDAPIGWMLDIVVSAGVEQAADGIESIVAEDVRATAPGLRALRYSPGYCGWHLAGQRPLFDRLRPEEINIALTESFIMDPVKSVSGVIIVASPESHLVDNSAPCCSRCRDRSCEERMKRIAMSNP